MRPGFAAFSPPATKCWSSQSCDKNFGVYRDRVGCLFLKTASREASDNAMGHVLQIAREMWSMPPDHGGAVVRTVLQDAGLTADWRVELEEMRGRIVRIRERLAAADPSLEFIRHQMGMFSMLPVSPEQVLELREKPRHLHGRQRAVQRAGHGRRCRRPLRRRRRRGRRWLT